MKYLVDEALPRSVARALSEAGIDAVHALDLGLQGKPDAEVLARAVETKRVLLTKDVKFLTSSKSPSERITVVFIPEASSKAALAQRVVDVVRSDPTFE